MYQLAISLYTLGVMIASLFNPKARKMWKGGREAFRVLRRKVDPGSRYVWFHAASLGEFEQGRPIIERLRAAHPEYKILLTFFSPSGYEVRKDYAQADIVCYLPLDTYYGARKFLSLVRPEMAFFIKYEFWWNYLHILKRRGVPVYSVSSIFREGQVFFRRYGRGYARVLRCFTRFFVQNDESRLLLSRLGIDCVDVTGDTRFDRVLQVKSQARELPLVDAFCCGSRVFVAGSSKLKMPVVRYTEATEAAVRSARCLIIDCFGLLSAIYGYGSVAYVGGGFGVGIHNVLEAAVWGMPVIFGPNNRRFQEARALIAAGGGMEISSYSQFEAVMNTYEADPRALADDGRKAAGYVEAQAGATAAILSAVGL